MRTFKQHIQEAPAIAPVLGPKPSVGPAIGPRPGSRPYTSLKAGPAPTPARSGRFRRMPVPNRDSRVGVPPRVSSTPSASPRPVSTRPRRLGAEGPKTDPQRAKLDRMRTMARNNPKAAALARRFSFGLANKVLADPNRGPDPRQSGTKQRPKALSTDTVQPRGAVTSRPSRSNRGPVLEPDRFRDKYSNISGARGQSDRRIYKAHDIYRGPRSDRTAIFGKKDQFSPRPPSVYAPTDKEIDMELKMTGREIRSRTERDAEKNRELRRQSAIKSSQRRAKIRERSRKFRERLKGGDVLNTPLPTFGDI